MPAKSKAQHRFMGAVAGGKARKKPKSLSKKEAKEFIRGQKQKGLPERVKKKKSSKSKRKGNPHGCR